MGGLALPSPCCFLHLLPLSPLLPCQRPCRPDRPLPGTEPCHLAACPEPGVTLWCTTCLPPGGGSVCSLAFCRETRGVLLILLEPRGPSQGCHVIRTLHTAEGWGRRAAASSQRFPPRRAGERPAAPVRPRMRRSPAPASSSWAHEGP